MTARPALRFGRTGIPAAPRRHGVSRAACVLLVGIGAAAAVACDRSSRGSETAAALELPADLSVPAYTEPDARVDEAVAGGDLRGALRPALEALLAAPGADRPWERLSGLYVQLRDDEAGAALFAKLGERFPGAAAPARYEGFHRFRQGAWDAALEAYARAGAADPTAAEPFFRRGLILQSVGRFDEALVELDRALAVAPGDAAIHARRVRLLRILGNYDEAERSARAAIERFPRNAALLHALGSMDLRAGRLDAAEDRLRRALGLDGALREAHLDWARLMHARGREAEARRSERYVRRLADLRDRIDALGDRWAADPSNAEVALELAEAELVAYRLEGARTWLDRARDGGADPDRLGALEAEWALHGGDAATAVQSLAGTAPSPRRSLVEALLAIGMNAGGEARRALEAAESSDDRDVLYRVGDAWAALGELDRSDRVHVRAESVPAGTPNSG